MSDIPLHRIHDADTAPFDTGPARRHEKRRDKRQHEKETDSRENPRQPEIRDKAHHQRKQEQTRAGAARIGKTFAPQVIEPHEDSGTARSPGD